MVLCKCVGACLIALCGWCGGEFFCRKARLRRRELQQTIALLQRLLEEIGYCKTDLRALYGRLAEEPAFSLLRLPRGGSFQTLEPPAGLSGEERACFAECLKAVGRAPAAQECARLKYYIARFETAAASALTDEGAARQLYGRLGLGAGAMLAIALL